MEFRVSPINFLAPIKRTGRTHESTFTQITEHNNNENKFTFGNSTPKSPLLTLDKRIWVVNNICIVSVYVRTFTQEEGGECNKFSYSLQ